MKPLISIIVPVYNVEAYLSKCVNSIREQTYINLEIILVDDGSTDSSGIICDDFEKKDSRIRVIHKSNGGLSDARNVALECMKGQYVTFVDSDDWISKDYVSHLYKLIVYYGSQIAIGEYIDVYENVLKRTQAELEKGKKNIRKVFNNPDAVEMLLYQRYFSTSACCKLYDAELWKDIRFPQGVLYEDVVTIYDVLSKTNKIAVSNHIIYYYLQRNNSIVRNNFSIKKMDYVYNMQEVCRKVQETYPQLGQAAISRLLWAEIHVLVHMDNSTKYADCHEILWDDIRKKRLSVIVDPKSRLQNKIVALMSYGGDRALKSFFWLHKHRK